MASNQGKHVMLSYNHKSKDIVIQVKEQLENNGIPVWFDERDMGDNMFDSMPEAVGNAFVVCCFMTPDYENSRNCKLEVEHAQRRGKRIIPCMVSNRKVWKPSADGWLNFITGSIIAIDFSGTSGEHISATIKKLIDRIHEKPSDSPVIPKKSDFFEPIRHEYLRNSRIQRMMNEEKSFPIEQSYINLAIVEIEKQREKEKNLRQAEHNDAIISSFEEIYGSKTSINVKDIFEKCKDQTKKLLVLGRAGIGKSTFCRYVSHQWAKGELWTQYQLVILIRLRLLTNDRYPKDKKYLPVDFVEKEYFPCDTIPSEDKQCFKELCNKGQVLWLLDGYDEFVQNIPKQLEDLFNYILGTQHHILTSRPYSIALSYDAKMEITGFTDENIAKYVDQFFDQIKDQLEDTLSEGQRLLSFLKTNPGIWGVAHIPVNLELICSLWGDIETSKVKIMTMTSLYDNITQWLCRRYLAKHNIDNVHMKKKAVYARCQKELAFLESLAFHGMEDNCIILRPDLLEKAETETSYSLDDHPELLKTGILHSLNDKPIGSHIQSQIDYYFVHLSFQEHFAARFLVNALASHSPQKAIEFIKSNKYNQRFSLVFTFASGLLTDKNVEQYLNTFWDTLLTEPLDLVGFRHIQIIISCLEEVSDGSKVHRHAEIIDSVKKWITYTVGKRPQTIYDQLANSLQRSGSLVREQIIITQLIDLLSNSNSHIKTNACSLIAALLTYNPHQEFLFPLTSALGDENENVRRGACDALGKMGEKAATSEVIRKIVSAFGDEDEYVRRYACKALGEMGEKAATSEVISKLVSALGDENEYVRRYACEALGEMGEKTATSEVISKLVSALGDENEYVRRYACEALGKMGEKAGTSEVISKLMSVLGDENKDVRSSVCEALGKMGEKAATSEVISQLVSALGDEDKYVKGRVCEVLGKMGEKAATSEVISKLVSALGDENKYVKGRAYWALGAIGEKAATSEVISKLVSALGDEDEDVRRYACEALGKMDEKAGTSEVISKIVSALGDEDEDVRRYACEALGEMGEKAATSEVISKLVSALGDESKDVRSSVCEALGKMDEKAATSEVISKLVNALGDEDEYVRRYACEALGKMGEKAATSEVISKLVSALGDEDEDVRRYACETLSKMGEKAATSEVISKLVSALGDEDEYVRRCACETLGEMGEKAATSELISKLVSALGDENEYVRRYGCEALGKMGEKAATSEVISKLVSALGDESKDVRSSVCEALGKMGEKAATSEVISKLVSAFGDENEYVRRYACEALGKMGEKAATSEVISKLVSALGDEDEYDKWNACEALGKMGEKAATSEVITKLLDVIERYDAENAMNMLEKYFTSFAVVAELDSDTVIKLLSCLDGSALNRLRFVCPEIFINVFLCTKNSDWLSVAIRVALRECVGVTVLENIIMVYGSKEPVKLECSDEKVVDQLVNAFVEQATMLDLPHIPPRKACVSLEEKEEFFLPVRTPTNADVRLENHSSMCTLL